MHKRFYITRKQVLNYIVHRMPKFDTLKEFRKSVIKVIDDLSEYPDDNFYQLRFFNRVQLVLGDLIEGVTSLEDIPEFKLKQ